MMFVDLTFIGIDIPGVRKPLTCAVLDANLDLVALQQGTVDEVLAYVNGQDKAYVAVNNPRRLNQGLMAREDFRAGLRPQPRAGRWEGWRVAEYEMRMRRIKVHRTPHTPENAPGWMRIGFSIYRDLAASGFKDLSGLPGESEEKPERVMMETYPHAAFSALLERLPFRKNSLEGRIQRQLALYVRNVEVPNPMHVFEEITRFRLLSGELLLDGLLEPGELDAVVAAYTAWSAARGDISLVGHPDEGQVTLPVRELQAKYR